MIDALYTKVKDLDIRVFTLTSGKVIIGEVVHAYEDGVQLNCPLEIRKALVKSGVYSEIMLPLVAGNDTENCIVYDRSIETESDTTDAVKRKYTEALIYQRLAQLMSESSKENEENEIEESEDYDYSIPEIDLPDSSQSDEELWNIFLDRWKNV
jgi:disulfide oxidoreductase YuzD